MFQKDSLPWSLGKWPRVTTEDLKSQVLSLTHTIESLVKTSWVCIKWVADPDGGINKLSQLN